MNNDFDKEMFSSEELEILNKKLKNTENLTLPERIESKAIETKLQSEAVWKLEESKKMSRKAKKRMIYSFVAAAASFAIVVTSLMVAKPWERQNEPPLNNEKNPPVVDAALEDYSVIEQKFSDYAEKYKAYEKTCRLYGAIDGVLNGFTIKAQNTADTATGQAHSSAKPETYQTNDMVSKETEDDYGETNEQVRGVNEADIIKNDGKYIYAANPDNADWESYYNAIYKQDGLVETTVNAAVKPGSEGEDENAKVSEETGGERLTAPVLKYDCKISVVEPKKDGKINKIGEINIAQDDEKDVYHMVVSEIYVKGNRLIALVDCTVRNENAGSGFNKFGDVFYTVGKQITMAVCFDITDRANAKEMWRAYQDGSYVSSRLVGNQLVFLSNYYVDITDEKETVINNCVPEVASSSGPMERITCECLVVGSQVDSPNYLVASNINIENDKTLKTQAILGAGSNVYCTTETLYATTTTYKDREAGKYVFGTEEQITSIYKFDIRNGDIKYLGCGSVKGSSLNQFSIDEYNGYLRIATTTGSWGDSLSNQLYVLDSDLKVVGEITGIAKGETIKSVRFTGDTGYVVTFEQTDPLFVIDLSNPQKPEIKGELKIPGFSAYLHPVGENLLLGVGVDGTESGQGSGMKISLFDVSDPKNPVETDKIEINGVDTANRWTYIYSEAFYSHKALCWDSDDMVMYIPYGKQSRIWAASNGETLSRTNTAGIVAVKVNAQTKTLSTDGEYVFSSANIQDLAEFSRVTYIGDVIIGFNRYVGGGIVCTFDKTTQTLSDTCQLNK